MLINAQPFHSQSTASVQPMHNQHTAKIPVDVFTAVFTADTQAASSLCAVVPLVG